MSSSCLDTLRTRYNVERVPFNRGLEGELYRATSRDPTVFGLRAIKVKPLADIGGTDIQVLAFGQDPEAEAIILSQLSPHEGFVQYYEHVVGEQDVCLVEEYIDGITLCQLVEKDIPLSVKHFVALFHRLSQSIHHLHTQGMAHNDLNPGNLMISSEGVLKVLDFGMARRGSPDKDLASMAALIPALYGPTFHTIPELCNLYKNPFALLGEVPEYDIDLFEQIDDSAFPFQVASLPAQTSGHELGFFETSDYMGGPEKLPVSISLISRSSMNDEDFLKIARALMSVSRTESLMYPIAMMTRQRFHWIVFLVSVDLIPARQALQISPPTTALAAIECVEQAFAHLHHLGLSFCSPHLPCSISKALYFSRRLGRFLLRPHAIAPILTSQEGLASSFDDDKVILEHFKQSLATLLTPLIDLDTPFFSKEK